MKFKIQVGRDARIYYSAEIEADSLEEAKANLSRHGYRCSDDIAWVNNGVDEFDHVETCHISDGNGNSATYSDNDGWDQ